jgi:peptide/nickel transport system substrate-binding protein
MSGGAIFAFDPQAEWSVSPWELYRCCLLRTLMSYAGASGPQGTEPKPDLASQPPSVSTDGLTWTFHLRPGLHYGPPLQGVPITSGDIVRALLRAGDPHQGNPFMGTFFLSIVDGFADYAAGKTESISGLETPDPYTLLIHETAPDATLPYRFTLPLTAPIPPSPSDPSTTYGIATGHDRSPDPAAMDGYGRFLVSSGPYMIQGIDRVDFTQPPDKQVPASGFVPWRYTSSYQPRSFGSLTLVRNPSWNRASDPLRPALPDRIVIQGGESRPLNQAVDRGDLAMVFDQTPPASLERHYLDEPSLRPLVHSLDTGNVVLATFNLTQAPFDDLWVRRAVAYALDRRTMVGNVGHMAAAYGFGGAVLADHYAADVTEDALASGWSPFPGPNGAPDLQAAHRAMDESGYPSSGGRCTDPACVGVRVILHPGLGALAEPIRRSLAAVGIRGDVAVNDDFNNVFGKPAAHIGVRVGSGWFDDYPSAGNLLVAEFGGPNVAHSDNETRMGATSADLKRLKLPAHPVPPSVDPQIRRCNEEVGAAQIPCWTRLDQYLLTQVMPAVPLIFGQVVRLSSPQIASFSWDQGFQEPAIDRLAVADG